jgi:hypothetical protein
VGQPAGRVTLRAGTLYAALDRLGADGWVDVDREEIVDGRQSRSVVCIPLSGRIQGRLAFGLAVGLVTGVCLDPASES